MTLEWSADSTKGASRASNRKRTAATTGLRPRCRGREEDGAQRVRHPSLDNRRAGCDLASLRVVCVRLVENDRPVGCRQVARTGTDARLACPWSWLGHELVVGGAKQCPLGSAAALRIWLESAQEL